MRIGVLPVTNASNPYCRIKVAIRGSWLENLGFNHKTPVIATPQPSGFTLRVADANAVNATGANVVNATTDTSSSGKLIYVWMEDGRPALHVNFAGIFAANGLAVGDFLAVRYEYGLIEARKLPPAQKYYVVGTHNHGAFLRLYGNWLDDAGVMLDGGVVTVAVATTCITLRVWDEPGLDYADIVKFARRLKYQLVQAQKNQDVTFIDLDGYLLNRAGFDSGDICGVRYVRGIITLFKPDLQKLGLLQHQGLLS